MVRALSVYTGLRLHTENDNPVELWALLVGMENRYFSPLVDARATHLNHHPTVDPPYVNTWKNDLVSFSDVATSSRTRDVVDRQCVPT